MATEREKTERTTVMLPVNLKEQARQLAQQDDVSISVIVRRALRKHLEGACSPPTQK